MVQIGVGKNLWHLLDLSSRQFNNQTGMMNPEILLRHVRSMTMPWIYGWLNDRIIFVQQIIIFSHWYERHIQKLTLSLSFGSCPVDNVTVLSWKVSLRGSIQLNFCPVQWRKDNFDQEIWSTGSKGWKLLNVKDRNELALSGLPAWATSHFREMSRVHAIWKQLLRESLARDILLGS